MARIELKEVAHTYAADDTGNVTWALRPMTTTWRDGGAYALLGPSGCGKTTLLNIVSGLLTPTRGNVLFDGIEVTSLPPAKRNISQVFQFPVVYDTMTVFDNLAFPLRNRGWRAGEIERRVREIAGLLELDGELHHRARDLTADAKQKISLGRGLTRPDVAAILFDEPLTVIDPQIKWQLRRKLKQIHAELNLTLLYVTHDQTEALTFADEVIVMTEGAIVQTGTAQQLFETPQHTFVGQFIGSPGMNILPCKLGEAQAVVDGHSFALGANRLERARKLGSEFKIGIRAEFVEVFPREEPASQPVTVRSARAMGTHTLIEAQIGSSPFWIKAREEIGANVTKLWMRTPVERVVLFANDRAVT